MTMTHSNGVCNKVDRNGNFIAFSMQPNSDRSARLMEAIGLNQHHSLDKKETHRMIAGRGVVTIFFQDGIFRVMHPSGFMELSCKGDGNTDYQLELEKDYLLGETKPHLTL